MKTQLLPRGEQVRSSGLLRGKIAVVFAAAESLGTAVAAEFAELGAEVFLSGRTQSAVEEVRRHIAASGGRAHAAAIDALNDAAVDDYVCAIAKKAGSIDIVFNAAGPAATVCGSGEHAVSQFITARAAARQMLKQHSGVIMFLARGAVGGQPAGATAPGAGFGVIEALMENLAAEVGPAGVGVVGLSPVTIGDTARTAALTAAGRLDSWVAGVRA
jgi:NADP-dependent 3-hydroxy acid dehydrogenase YdfG